MLIYILTIIIGFLLLIKGADILVEGASQIAKKFHIPEIVIGLTIVAVGTSMPELVVSLTSAIEGYSDLAIGNVIGSNIANLFLILGVCSTIKSLKFKKETRIFEIPITIISTILLFILCVNGYNQEKNIIMRSEGIILLGGCILFIIYNLIMAKKGDEFEQEKTLLEIKTHENTKISVCECLIGIMLGIIGLKIGGDLVVDGSVEIARIIGITEKLISLTIVAFSTSLPELITSITATKKGDTDMAIGNVLGSQIFNILLIIGVSATVSPINYSIEYNNHLIFLMIGSIILGLFPFVGKKNEMTRKNGIIFVLAYISYLVSLIYFS